VGCVEEVPDGGGWGDTGGQGSPVVMVAGTRVGKVCGARAVHEDSPAGSGNDRRRLPMARPSRWGKADGAAKRQASPWHDASLRSELGSMVMMTHVDVAAWLQQLPVVVFDGVAVVRGGEAEAVVSRAPTTPRRGIHFILVDVVQGIRNGVGQCTWVSKWPVAGWQPTVVGGAHER
jgi:hypothetical protein